MWCSIAIHYVLGDRILSTSITGLSLLLEGWNLHHKESNISFYQFKMTNISANMAFFREIVK